MSKQSDEAWPSCSADGSVVAWSNFYRPEPGGAADSQIWVSQNGQISAATEGDGLHTNPSVSGDGKRIAYMYMDSEDMRQRAIVLLQPQA